MNVKKLLHALGDLVFPGFAICSLGTIAYQSYTWLKFGSWPPVSLIDALNYALQGDGDLGAWALTGNTWIGLWRFIDHVPLSLSLFLVGVIGGAATSDL